MPNTSNVCSHDSLSLLNKLWCCTMTAIQKVQAIDVHHTFKSKQTTVCTVGWDSVASTATSKFKTHRFVYIPMCCSKITFPFQVEWCGSNCSRLVWQSPVENGQVTNNLKTGFSSVSFFSSRKCWNICIFVLVVYLITLSGDLH